MTKLTDLTATTAAAVTDTDIVYVVVGGVSKKMTIAELKTEILTGAGATWGSITGTLSAQTDLNSALGTKQDTLVSATNIKTVNSGSILGAGNLSVKRWYSLNAGANSFSPTDSSTGYIANISGQVPASSSTQYVITIPRSGTIVSALLELKGTSTAGSSENISVYLRHNDTTDYLVKTVGVSNQRRVFDNDAMSIAVVAGDFVVFKMVSPAWATNPTSIVVSGTIIIEE